MKNDEIQNRKDKRSYLTNWLHNFGQAQEIVPRVQKELEKTEWEIDALSNLPDEAVEIPSGDMTILFINDFKFLTNEALPMIPTFDVSKMSSSDAITTSGTASVYGFVARIGDIATSSAFDYSYRYTKKYQEIQLAHNRPNEIRMLLAKLLNSNTAERFNKAEISYLQFKAGIGEKTSAAFELRTFVYGLSGDLFQIARRWEKENMTWEIMAERLSKDGQTGMEYSEMIRQKIIHSCLISRLSDVGKDREGGSFVNLHHIWTEMLDHVFIVLTITNW
jgi:hypothetical protein